MKCSGINLGSKAAKNTPGTPSQFIAVMEKDRNNIEALRADLSFTYSLQRDLRNRDYEELDEKICAMRAEIRKRLNGKTKNHGNSSRL